MPQKQNFTKSIKSCISTSGPWAVDPIFSPFPPVQYFPSNVEACEKINQTNVKLRTSCDNQVNSTNAESSY